VPDFLSIVYGNSTNMTSAVISWRNKFPFAP